MTLFSFLKYLALKVLYYTIRWRQVCLSSRDLLALALREQRICFFRRPC